MPNFDLASLLPIVFALFGSGIVTWIFASFPIAKQFVTALPKVAIETIVKAKDPNATIQWSTAAVDRRRAELFGEREALLASSAGGVSPDNLAQRLAAINVELDGLPPSGAAGGIIDWIKANPMIVVIIAGAAFFLISGGGGCKKTPAPVVTPPAVTTPAAPEVTESRPTHGLSLAMNQ